MKRYMKKKFALIVPLIGIPLTIFLYSCTGGSNTGKFKKPNVAVLATVTSPSRGGQSVVAALNDGLIPDSVPVGFRERYAAPGRQGRPQRLGVLRYECIWETPVNIDESAIFLFNYDSLVKMPQAYRYKYWNGNEYVPVENAVGLGLVNDQFNNTSFTGINTTKLMIEIDSVQRFMPPILEWMVFKSKGSPAVAPLIKAGGDRNVITGGKTYLSGIIKSVGPLKNTQWTAKGPGQVEFADPGSPVTTASFSVPGEYVLTLTSQTGKMSSS